MKALGGLNFKDKRLQAGLAAAAVVGVVVLARRGGVAGEPAGDPSPVIQPAQFDSTGPDVYNAIQSIGTAWTNDLRDFTSQLEDIEDQLGRINGPAKPTTPTKPTGTKPAPSKVLPINPKLKTGQGFYILKRGDTEKTVAKRAGISVDLFRALNPGGKLNRFAVGEAVRIRAVAGPPPKRNGVSLWR